MRRVHIRAGRYRRFGSSPDSNWGRYHFCYREGRFMRRCWLTTVIEHISSAQALPNLAPTAKPTPAQIPSIGISPRPNRVFQSFSRRPRVYVKRAKSHQFSSVNAATTANNPHAQHPPADQFLRDNKSCADTRSNLRMLGQERISPRPDSLSGNTLQVAYTRRTAVFNQTRHLLRKIAP